MSWLTSWGCHNPSSLPVSLVFLESVSWLVSVVSPALCLCVCMCFNTGMAQHCYLAHLSPLSSSSISKDPGLTVTCHQIAPPWVSAASCLECGAASAHRLKLTAAFTTTFIPPHSLLPQVPDIPLCIPSVLGLWNECTCKRFSQNSGHLFSEPSNISIKTVTLTTAAA